MADEKKTEVWEIPTTAQVQRVYRVEATDLEQAQKRLRSFIADADSIREGVVVLDPEKQTDTTPQKIVSKGIKKIPARPVAVKDEAAAS